MLLNRKISVCIATYNGGSYITNQLCSILPQLQQDDEIIISDDSSSDNTLELIKKLDDKRVKIFKNQKFNNPIFNFENALVHAIGDIIFLADQDDVWMPNKVKTMLTYLENSDLVLSDCTVVSEHDELLFSSFFEKNNSQAGLFKNLVNNSYMGCCMAFNRRILTKALPFPSDIPMHDWWIGLIAERFGKVFFCDKKLIAYRRHSNNASVSGGNSRYSWLKKMQFRIVMIKNLVKRNFSHE
jgi:glycosyltransferase involved in cell wall biosynthesis